MFAASGSEPQEEADAGGGAGWAGGKDGAVSDPTQTAGHAGSCLSSRAGAGLEPLAATERNGARKTRVTRRAGPAFAESRHLLGECGVSLAQTRGHQRV